MCKRPVAKDDRYVVASVQQSYGGIVTPLGTKVFDVEKQVVLSKAEYRYLRYKLIVLAATTVFAGILGFVLGVFLFV